MKKRFKVLMTLEWYDGDIHRGIIQCARENNWILDNSMYRNHILPTNWKGDGIVGLITHKETRNFAIESKVAVVDIGFRYRKDFPQVIGDHEKNGRWAAQHFIERKYQNFNHKIITQGIYCKMLDGGN